MTTTSIEQLFCSSHTKPSYMETLSRHMDTRWGFMLALGDLRPTAGKCGINTRKMPHFYLPNDRFPLKHPTMDVVENGFTYGITYSRCVFPTLGKKIIV